MSVYYIDGKGDFSNCNSFDINSKRPYQVDSSTDGVMYFRYASGTGNCVIFRITTESGVDTTEIAFGAWSNRATLEYTPCNDPLEV